MNAGRVADNRQPSSQTLLLENIPEPKKSYLRACEKLGISNPPNKVPSAARPVRLGPPRSVANMDLSLI